MISASIRQSCPLCLSETPEFLTSSDLLRRDYFRCRECRLIFVPREFHLSEKEEHERYRLHRNDPADQHYRQFLSRLTQPLSSRLKPQAQGLDFGCGPGPTVAVMLAEQGKGVDNYDPFFYPDETLLKKQYDFITCTEVVEHFCSPREGFLQLNNLLKGTDSVLGIMTRLWQEEGEFINWWYQKDPSHVSFYSPATFDWISAWLNWEGRRVAQSVYLFNKKR